MAKLLAGVITHRSLATHAGMRNATDHVDERAKSYDTITTENKRNLKNTLLRILYEIPGM